MNRSAAAIGIGVLAIAIIVGVILFLQLPSPDMSAEQARQTDAPAGTTAPPAQTAGTPASSPAAALQPDEKVPVAPSVDVARVDRKGNVVIAGKAGADCVVTVRVGDSVIGTATADRRGDWVIVPGEPLPAGESQLTLSSRCGDAAPVDSENVVVLIVPERAPAIASAGTVPGAAPGTTASGGVSPGTDQPAADGGARSPAAVDRAIAVAVPRDASKPAAILQSGTPSTDSVAIDSVDYDEKGQVVVSGHAPPGGTVQVYLDNRIVGRVVANAEGRWTLVPDDAIAPGQYALRADLVRPDGAVVARVEIPFVRGEPLTDLPAGRIVVIQPGDYLWKIARVSYGAGTRYTMIYEANKAQIRDPDLIYPGQVFTLQQVN